MLKNNNLKKKKIINFFYKPLITSWLFNLNTHYWFWQNIEKFTPKKRLFSYFPTTIQYIKNNGNFTYKCKQIFKKKNKKKDFLRQKIKKKWTLRLTFLKIPTLLLRVQKQYLRSRQITATLKQFAILLDKKCQQLFFVVKNGWKYYFLTKKNINTPWQIFKKIKYQHKLTKLFECRKLNRLKSFYRNFGFCKNKRRFLRTLTRTKKFKKFKVYDQILQLSYHKKKVRGNNNYFIQSCRTKGPSYYKIKEQLFCYWHRNYFSNNFTKKKVSKLTNKFNKYKKKRLIKFISKIELTLSSLLLRTRLLKTIGITHQFIRHGHVYVNYKKVLSPSYNVKPGDSISIYINSWKQRYHRINDPLYANRLMQGLYKKNTGRQSLTAREKQPEFIKTSLNNLSTIHDTITPADKIIMHDILPFSAKDRIKMNNNMRTDNSPNVANWKISFLYDTIQGSFVQQNKYIDYINNSLA